MIPEEHHIEVRKTTRYFVLGEAPSDSEKILIALHGYGQLPAYFIRHFEPLIAAGWTVIAPEGLHRFYQAGTNGRVGASWMTKEDRETDMSDYITYLNQLANHLNLSDRKPFLLGFSQGVATAARWACMGDMQFERLIFWSGVFPPDLDWDHGIEPLKQTPIDVAFGDADPFFDEDILRDTSVLLEAHKISHQPHVFHGGHSVNSQLLLELLETK